MATSPAAADGTRPAGMEGGRHLRVSALLTFRKIHIADLLECEARCGSVNGLRGGGACGTVARKSMGRAPNLHNLRIGGGELTYRAHKARLGAVPAWASLRLGGAGVPGRRWRLGVHSRRHPVAVRKFWKLTSASTSDEPSFPRGETP